MLAGYETEQTGLKERAVELETLIAETTVKNTNIESFLRLVRSYTEVKELNVELGHEIIEKVLIGKAKYVPARFFHWARGKTQEVRIIYNFLGDGSKIARGK